MRFYGLSFQDVLNLPVVSAEMLLEQIESVRAKETLLALKIADYPHLKKEARTKWARELHKVAYPGSDDRQKPVTTADLARLMGGGGKWQANQSRSS